MHYARIGVSILVQYLHRRSRGLRGGVNKLKWGGLVHVAFDVRWLICPKITMTSSYLAGFCLKYAQTKRKSLEIAS